MKRIDLSAEMAKFVSCATRHMRAHINFKFLCSVLISFIYMWYMFSISINLNDLNDLHLIMLIWSFKCYWINALLFHIYARINYDYLLILHMLSILFILNDMEILHMYMLIWDTCNPFYCICNLYR